jgi:NAD(P)-dependent dehydrogenase (short-subunit alcohol dehydrogenase family)
MGIERKPILEADPQDIENIIKTNLFSQVMMTKKFFEHRKQTTSVDPR